MLGKPWVQAVVWNQFDDSQPHDFPHAGLLGPQGQVKPALRRLRPSAQRTLIHVRRDDQQKAPRRMGYGGECPNGTETRDLHSHHRLLFLPTQTRQMSSLCGRLPTNCLTFARICCD